MKKYILNILIVLLFSFGTISYAHPQEFQASQLEQITQGEFVVQLVKALGLDTGLTDTATVSDYIERLKSRGIEPVDGYQSDKLITKEEKALLISKALGLEVRLKEEPRKPGQFTRDRAIIIHLEGKVQVKLGGTKEWIKASKGMKLSENAYIRTGPNSSVDLSVGIAGRVKIKENTELLLKTLSTKVDGKSETVCLYLAMGEMTVDVTRITESSLFLTTTPTVTVGVRGTIYNVTVSESKTEIK